MNAFVIYNQNMVNKGHRAVSRLQFIKNLVQLLIAENPDEASEPRREPRRKSISDRHNLDRVPGKFGKHEQVSSVLSKL